MSTETRVYIGGMPADFSEDEVRRHLSIYGQITDMTLRKGYAIVRFESAKDALDVVSVFANRRLLGADVNVSMYVPRRMLNSVENPPDRARVHRAARSDDVPRRPVRDYTQTVASRCTVVVMSLHKDTCWQQLKDFGRSKGGRVAFCEVSKGVGFIKFETKEDAQMAIKKLDGQELLQSHVRVISLEEYDRSRESEILRAGRMRSRSPDVRTTARPEQSMPNTRNFERGRGRPGSPVRLDTFSGENVSIGHHAALGSSTKMAAYLLGAVTVEPGELLEEGKQGSKPADPAAPGLVVPSEDGLLDVYRQAKTSNEVHD